MYAKLPEFISALYNHLLVGYVSSRSLKLAPVASSICAKSALIYKIMIYYVPLYTFNESYVAKKLKTHCEDITLYDSQ